MKELRVGEIMIPLEKYPRVLINDTLRQAMKVLEESVLAVGEHQSLPRVALVFNENGNLAGMVRRRDILRGMEPNFLIQKPLNYRKKLFDVSIDPNLSAISYEEIIDGVTENMKKPVSSVIRPIEMTVNYDDHIFLAIYEMNSCHLSLLPVLKDKIVVGIVRSVDVFHEVAKLLL
jgi:CBS-domain-containing membrane protein